MRKRIHFILRLFVSFGILFVLFGIVPYDDIISQFEHIDLRLFLWGFLIFICLHLIGILRWKVCLSALGVYSKYKDLFLLFFSGLFFNVLFPSVVAQDVFRASILSFDKKEDAKKTIASVVIDRFSGLVSLCIVAVLALLAGITVINDTSIILAVSALAVIVAIISGVFFSRRIFNFFMFIFKHMPNIRDKLKKFHDNLYFFRQNPKAFLKVMFLAFIIQLGTPVSFYLLGLSFGIQIPAIIYFVLIPVIMTISLIPVTIAGLGTGQAAGVYFFSQVGVDEARAFGVSLLISFFYIILGVCGGILYVTFYNRRLQSHKQNTGH